MLVSLGAAAYTIAGAYGGWALLGGGVGTVEDPGRVAAQIITGIGFLGAGTIWRSSGDEGVIRGLTTAASIWVAASIGMLTGYGLYVLAAGTAILSLAVLRMIKGVERAPRVLTGVVAGRLRRRTAHGPSVAYQPARAPAVMEAPPHPPADGQVETGDTTATLAEAEPPAIKMAATGAGGAGKPGSRERAGKKPGKGKKGRKGKRRDLPSEELDEISDAPDFPVAGATRR
jgi:hypothetical protein